MLIANKPAICPNCGDTNQVCYFWVPCDLAFGEAVPRIRNFCSKCGAEIDKDSGEVIYGTAGRNIDFLFKEKPWEKRMMN